MAGAEMLAGYGGRSRLLVAAVLLGVASVRCGDGIDTSDGGFRLVVSPEFVQGAFPGVPVSLLVTIAEEGAPGDPVRLKASVSGKVTVSLSDEHIAAGELAEVTVTAGDVDRDAEITLTVTAERGGAKETAARSITVIPGGDDRGPAARAIFAKFAAWLASNHPQLGITEQTTFDGSVVAPRLLVVSHYSFRNGTYEVGLSWHIMVAPDDWAEIYLRPLNQLRPTLAFRMSSWSTALNGGAVAFTEVAPPAEVVR